MTKKKYGFSIMEALLVLLIVSLSFVVVSHNVMTKKKIVTRANLTHGKWVCKNINGVQKSVVLDNVNAEIPDDNHSSWVNGCTPPKPHGAKYFFVEVYGAGGGGSLGEAKPWVTERTFTNFGDSVRRSGEYSISFNPSNGGGSTTWTEASKTHLCSSYSDKYDENCWGKNTSFYYTEEPLRKQCAQKNGAAFYQDVTQTDKDSSHSVTCEFYSKVDNQGITAGDAGTGCTIPPEQLYPTTGWYCNFGGKDYLAISYDDKNGYAINDETILEDIAGKYLGYLKDTNDYDNCIGANENNSVFFVSDNMFQCNGNDNQPKSLIMKAKCTKKELRCGYGETINPAYGGKSAPSISGTIKMNAGDKIAVERDEANKNKPTDIPDGNGSTAKLSYEKGKAGDTVRLYLVTSKSSGNSWSEVKNLIATFYGGGGGIYTTSQADYINHTGIGYSGSDYVIGFSELTDPVNREAYPNAFKNKLSLYALRGIDGSPDIEESDRWDLKQTSGSSNSGKLIIDDEVFESKNGCPGQNGAIATRTFPADQEFPDFSVGLGGAGESITSENDNRGGDSIAAVKGGDTSFGNLVAYGGNGATGSLYGPCLYNNQEQGDIRRGGNGGQIITNGTPVRDYNITADNDTAPNGRWERRAGGNGQGGMIVVSW